MKAYIRELTMGRPVGRFASAQDIKAELSMGKVNLATDQTMQPMPGDAEGVAKRIDITARRWSHWTHSWLSSSATGSAANRGSENLRHSRHDFPLTNSLLSFS